MKSNKSIVSAFLKQERGMTRPKLIKKLDKLVSDEVKRLANGRCAKCSQITSRMGCSHYFSRRYIGTRFDLDNLIWLCWLPCHDFYEHDKQGEYTDLMRKRLGARKLKTLAVKAYAVTKFSTADLKVLLLSFEEGRF